MASIRTKFRKPKGPSQPAPYKGREARRERRKHQAKVRREYLAADARLFNDIQRSQDGARDVR